MSKDGPSLGDWLKVAARAGQAGYGQTKRVTKRALGLRRPVRILPYRGYGNGRTAVLSGRVLESKLTGEPLIDDPWWRNLRSSYRTFTADVARRHPVAARYEGGRVETVTDDDGYFHFRFDDTDETDTPVGWHPVELVAPNLGGRATEAEGAEAKAVGQILVPPADSEFGVVSDMDDTVIRSSVTNFWKIARLTLLKNARTRMPFEGVAAFYRALAGGSDGTRHNPVFYVSSSAWNLYDLFRVFLEHNDIPAGPILLRDYGIDEDKFLVDPGHGHKLRKIDAIFAMYPRTKFVLIGDSGQADPVLYREAARRYPDRVRAIYIRDVVRKTRDDVARIASEVAETGVPMLLVSDTVAAAEHAAGLGLIDPAVLPDVRQDRAEDRSPTSDRQPVA